MDLRLLLTVLSIAVSVACADSNFVALQDMFRVIKTHQGETNVMKINSFELDKLVSIPRNFTLVVLFNRASGDNPCYECKEASRCMSSISSSFKKSHSPQTPQEIYFAEVDYFSGGQKAFNMFLIKEKFMFFAFAKNGNIFSMNKPTLSGIIGSIHDVTKIEINIKKEYDFWRMVVPLGLILVMATVSFIAWNHLQTFIRSPRFWTIVIISFIILMISGEMLVLIRKPSFMAYNDNGPIFVLPNSQSQLVVETYLISFLYMTCSVLFIYLTFHVTKIEDTSTRNAITVVSVLGVHLLMGFIVRINKIKNEGYPFSFIL